MIGCNRLFIFIAWILAAAPLSGEDRDLTSLHQFNGTLQLAEKVRLTLHTRLRFNHDLGDFFQFRGGPIVHWDWKRRLQWQTGYYWVEQQGLRDVVEVQRPWGGAQIRLYGNGGFSMDWRNLVERHIYAGPGDFTRVRTRIAMNFQPRVGWQPFANIEALALKGHVIGRYSGGMGYATSAGHLFGVGYEFRPEVGRPGSHIITTMVQFRIHGPIKRQKPGAAEVPH